MDKCIKHTNIHKKGMTPEKKGNGKLCQSFIWIIENTRQLLQPYLRWAASRWVFSSSTDANSSTHRVHCRFISSGGFWINCLCSKKCSYLNFWTKNELLMLALKRSAASLCSRLFLCCLMCTSFLNSLRQRLHLYLRSFFGWTKIHYKAMKTSP